MSSRADIAAGRGSRSIDMSISTTTLDASDIDVVPRANRWRCAPCLLVVTSCCAFFAVVAVGLSIAFPAYVYTRPTTTGGGAGGCRRMGAAEAAAIYENQNVAGTTSGMSASSDKLMDTLCDVVEANSMLPGKNNVILHATDLNFVLLYLHAFGYFTLDESHHATMTAYEPAADNLSTELLLQVGLSDDVYAVLNMAKVCSSWMLTSDASLNVDVTSVPQIFDDNLVCLHVVSEAAMEGAEAELEALLLVTFGSSGGRRLMQISTSLAAIESRHSLAIISKEMSDSMERLTTGERSLDNIGAAKTIALDKLANLKGDLAGATSTNEKVTANVQTALDNIAVGMNRIQDADFEQETASLTKSQILSQAATAMLAQANEGKQSVLNLLQS